MESDAGLVQGHGMHTRLPPCAPGYGMTRVQERASQRNLSKACQRGKSGGVGCRDEPGDTSVGQPVKLKEY